MPGGTLSAFRSRSFAILWSGSLVSNLGAQIQTVGAAWLMIAMTNSQGMVALVTTAASLPIVFVGLIAGVLADNSDRRKLMLLAQFAMLIASAVLVVSTWQDWLTPWLLLGFTFLIGCGTALHTPSWQSTLSQLVPREDLESAVSLNAMGMNVTRAVGPAAGGLITAQAGVLGAFIGNVLTYPALILALLIWKSPPRVQALPREPFLSSLNTGLRHFALSPRLWNPALRSLILGFAAIPVQALLPLVVRHQLAGDAVLFGVLLGCFGLGAVTAALINARLRQQLQAESLCRLGFFAGACAAVVVAFSPWALLTGIAVFVAGLCWLALFSLLNVSIQMATPRWVMGRILSIYVLSVYVGIAAGGLVWGFLAELTSTRTALLCSAAAMLYGVIRGLRDPLQPLLREDLEPVHIPTSAPMTLDHSLGPITVTVEYHIRDADLPEFMSCMTRRRQLRTIEGGRNWMLERDLDRRDLWFESFRFPSWLEYLRHQQRRTREDVALIDQLAHLHQGKTAPPITRSLRTRSPAQLPADPH